MDLIEKKLEKYKLYDYFINNQQSIINFCQSLSKEQKSSLEEFKFESNGDLEYLSIEKVLKSINNPKDIELSLLASINIKESKPNDCYNALTSMRLYRALLDNNFDSEYLTQKVRKDVFDEMFKVSVYNDLNNNGFKIIK